MRNRWGVEIKKGNWVRYKLVRGGEAEGYIRSIDRKGPMAGAYGPWINLTNGQSCSADDITETLGPMTVSKGGVVKQNPALREVYGSFDAYGKRRFFGPSQNEWGINHGFPFELESASIHGNAPIQFSKTRAYVCVDEDEYGQPVVEIWPIRNLLHPGVPNMGLKRWSRGDTGAMGRALALTKNNPLSRVKVKSPPQRPAGTAAAPGKRLVARRKKTAAAPKGFYANPVVRGESNADAVRYAELFGGAAGTIKAWSDHYIVRFHKPNEKNWTLQSVFKTKKDAEQYARAFARENPTYTVSVISKS